jgi:hypothetical protein
MFAVMSSPVVPSPRVDAWTYAPSRYVSAMAEPSIFISHTYVQHPPPSDASVRVNHASSSSNDSALSSEYIRVTWRTGAKAAEGGAPTRCVGESGVTRSGNSPSIASSSRTSAS